MKYFFEEWLQMLMAFAAVFGLIFVILILEGCMPNKPSNEMEQMSEDVLRHKEGVSIQILPVEKPKFP